jgi:hypothetical protein
MFFALAYVVFWVGGNADKTGISAFFLLIFWEKGAVAKVDE